METPTNHTDRPTPLGRATVVVGVIVMLFGGMLLADRFDWWGFNRNVPLWPWILILMGVARIGERRASVGRGVSLVGVWLLYVGSWGLVIEHRLWGLTYRESWPLLIVGVGGLIVWGSLKPTSECASRDR